MERDDVQLIRSTLSGNDEAFSTLVKKYQKSIHALAWRKIGDFHHAEEITQDTFLQAYKKLSTLKDPNQFAGWLYVIANRLCLNWMRKKKPMMQSLEGTRVGEVEKSSYTRYVSEQRETAAAEHRSEIVKKLLARLPESERTVVTLYYLGEMTSKEIGKFLGVSVKTVHSRLHRARKRLQEKDELLISEVLGGVQLPTHLIESVMQQVADMKPTGPPVAKPLLPWTAFGTAAVLVLLLFGVSNQYLIRYQKPYSFEAQSETIIEIIDAPVLLNVDSKPVVRNQIGRAATTDKSNGVGLQIDGTLSANTPENSAKFSASQWAQTNGPHGGNVFNIFVASEGICYAAAPTGIYRLTPDAPTWTRIDSNIPIGQFRMPMAEYADTLYIVSADKIFASIDKGETWHFFCSRPEGYAVGLIITNGAHKRNSHSRPVMYLALQTKGVFRSTDAGAQWHLLENGLTERSVYTVAAVENTVFAGTDSGLYRLNSDVWERLPVHPSDHAILSLTVFENNLYAGTGPNPSKLEFLESSEIYTLQMNITDPPSSERVFHSTDLGASWTEITSENKYPSMGRARRIAFLMNTGEVLLPQGVVTADKSTFYRASSVGIHRTTDGGKSWHPFMKGIMETAIQDLVAVNNRLYAHTDMGLVQSVDGGEVWETIAVNFGKHRLKESEEDFSPFHFSFASRLAIAGDVLYGIALEKDNLRLFQLPAGDNALVSVQRVPAFEQEASPVDLLKIFTLEQEVSFPGLWTGEVKHKHEHWSDFRETVDDLPAALYFVTNYNGIGGFAISEQTFYAEWKYRLFKWKLGDSEWTDTGLIDTSENGKFDKGFKLAVSADIIYVGKRDGTLFQSLDGGNSWRDITPNLPLRFTHFKEIVFAGSRVYVATDEGVLVSQNGEHWRVLTDRMGARTVIDKFAVHHTSVYGAGDMGIYRLDARGKWEQVSPSVPDKIVSLVAITDRLYIATQRRGVFHIPIEEEL